MFRFLKEDPEGNETTTAKNENEKIKLNVGSEIFYNDSHAQIAAEVPHLSLSEHLCLGKLSPKLIAIKQLLLSKFTETDSTIKQIIESSSDLITGVYEGGFKTWECSFDLINFLQETEGAFNVESKSRVLDLGCGSGILGLYALGLNAFVDFQDYNPEVMNLLTIPNVILNFGKEVLPRTRFFSGDWSSFDWASLQSRDPNLKYDYILSSETIYNINSLEKFYEVVMKHLSPSGKLYLAAKTCYFGVGGGTIAFKNLIKADGKMNFEVVHVIREGVQREILCVKFKNPTASETD